MYVEIDWINNVDMTYVVSTYGVNEVMHSIENFGGKLKSDILTLLYKFYLVESSPHFSKLLNFHCAVYSE